jgi:LSD1 subclass zinc finger protein
MSVEIPDILFRTKRGLCPNCGAPLRINPDEPMSACGFCGGKALLERRLRRAEPQVSGTPLRLYFNAEEQQHGVSPWVLRGQVGDRQEEEANCPGCGDVLHYSSDATIVNCPSCGTDSRVERRLRAPDPDLSRENAMPRHPSEVGSRDENSDDDPETEHLIYRILHDTDFNTRFRLAHKLGDQWQFANRTTARLLPALLRWMRNEDPRLQRMVSQVVCKLLCHGDPDLRNAAIQAVERVIFDLGCARPLLFEIGMGNGTCLKLLLDAAEFGVRSGDFQYACQALLGVDYIFQRNFEQHEVMGQIILYRMLYLTGPTLAFAFLLAQRQVTGTGFHYKPETLLRFIDEAVLERPTLVPELDRSFYCGGANNLSDLQYRIHFYRSLQSDEARRAALKHWMILPEEPSDEIYAEMVAFLEPLLDQPNLAEAAALPLQYAVGRGWRKMPDVIHDLVKRRGDSLPAEVRREYVQWVKDSPYIDRAKIPNWNSEPEPEMSPDMQKALEEWKAGLRAAVDHFDAIRTATSELYREVCGGYVEIFDGKSDGPKPAKKSRTSRSLVEAEEPEEIDDDDIEEDDDEDAEEAEAEAAEQERQEAREAFKRQIAELDQIIDGTCPHWAGMFQTPPGLTKEQLTMWEQSQAAMKVAIKQAQEDARKTKAMLFEEWKKRKGE